MALVPYKNRDPWRSLVSFRDEMDRMFDDWFGKVPSFRSHRHMPSVDVWEDNENVYVESDLPGMEQKDINVKMTGNSLLISAKREEKKEEKKKNYYRSERHQGSFYRAMDLPSSVDASKIKANYKGGVLKVTLPKKEEEKAKEIKINVE